MQTFATRWMGLILTVGLLCGSAGAQGLDALLVDSEENARWTRHGDGRTVVAAGVDYPVLELNAEPVRTGAVTAELATDAAYVYLAAGIERIKVDLPADGRATLTMRGGDEPALALDGEATAAWQAGWRRAVQGTGVKTVALRFGECTRAAATLDYTSPASPAPDGDGQDDGATAGSRGMARNDRRRTDDAASGQIDEATRRRVEAAARAAVVELRIDRPEAVGVGLADAVVVDPAGLAVASLHPLVGASRIEAKAFGVAEPIGVEVVDAAVDLDLALLRLRLDEAPMASALVKAAEPADSPPGEGRMLWVCPVTEGRHELYPAATAAVVGQGDLPRDWAERLGHALNARWVVMEAAMPPDSGGAAVLDADGRLAGLSVWTWLDRSESHVALAAEHVRRLVAGRPDEPIGLAGLADRLATAEAPPPVAAFPRLDVTTLPSPAKLRTQVQALRVAHRCRACDGEGELTRRVLAGYEQAGTMRKPVYRSEAQTCPTCEGTGLNDERAMRRLLGELIEAVARADRANAPTREALDRLGAVLAEIGAEHAAGLMRLLNDEARAAVGEGASRIGRPIVAVGAAVRELSLPHDRQPIVGLVLQDEVEARRRSREGESDRILLTRLHLDESGPGTLAIAGGLLAGYVQSRPDLPPLPIVSHGFIVPFTPQPEADDEDEQSATD